MASRARRHLVRELPAGTGLPLGLRALTSAPADADGPRSAVTLLRPGDTLLLYTDGVAETRDGAGTFYPLADRLAAHQRAHSPPLDPQHLLTWLQEDARDYSRAATYDDAALLALAWPPDRPSRRAETRKKMPPGTA